MSRAIEEISTCRICKSPKLDVIFDLGEQALGSVFPKEDEETPLIAPLCLVKCRNQDCGLVQLRHTVCASHLYTENYGYRSGLNNSMKQHLKDLVNDILYKVQLVPGDIVVDVGSNDATLLSYYNISNITKVGIDPSGPQFKEYYPIDVSLIPKFFDSSVYLEQYPLHRAKVLTSISMFYDLPDPTQFAKDVESILDDQGVWVMEQSYLPAMMKYNSFDTICHEHLEYYCLKQIVYICNHSGLKVFDVSFNNCNGGSFRVFICKQQNHIKVEDSVQNVLDKENEFDDIAPYQEFIKRIDIQKILLSTFLEQQFKDGKTISIYGASTKGNTLLQYYGINKDIIKNVAERNPRKFGCRTPGTSIPIVSEEQVRHENPDIMLVLPWHFRKEFISREAKYLESGGAFIFSLPEANVVCSRKVAMVIGSSGQLGHYLTEILIERDYMVYGISRSTKSMHTANKQYFNISCDITKPNELQHIINMIQPDEIYNLAAVTSSNESIDNPTRTFEINTNAVITLCNILKLYKKLHGKCIKLFQANSIELYKGFKESDIVVNEDRHYPTTPYGISKLATFWAVKNDRELYEMFFCSGICANMESKMRRDTYVTRKIVNYFKKGDYSTPLHLGNINITKDWVHARDAAMGMWLILQHHLPDDYIICTSTQNSIKDFVTGCALKCGLTVDWINDNCYTTHSLEQICLVVSNSSHSQRCFEKRINELAYSCYKLKSIGWLPKQSSLQNIINDMFES